MRYEVISADCHVDLPWLPEDLFTGEAPAELADRMPYVEETDAGRVWVSRKGARFGLQNGMGSAGRRYVPGQIHRSDRMAEQGLYRDGEAGIRRLTEPELRLRDQDLDGIQAEVLYGILGAAMRLGDDEAAAEMMRIYNAWLADFCATHPERFAGIANVPSHDVDAAVREVERVARRGVLRGIEVANTHDMAPLFDPCWEPLWAVAEDAQLPVHYHTIGPRMDYDLESMAALARRQAFAVHITSFQLAMAKVIMEIIYGGVLEAHPNLKPRRRRERHRLDPLHPRTHGPRMGGPVQGPDPDHEAVGILAPAVLRDLPERSDRHPPARRARRGQRDVGQRLPPSRRHLAGLAGVHRPGTRQRSERDPGQNRLRQCGKALRLRSRIAARPAVVGDASFPKRPARRVRARRAKAGKPSSTF